MNKQDLVQRITESLSDLPESELKAIHHYIQSLSSDERKAPSGSPVDEIDSVQNQQIPPPEGEIPGSRHDQFFT